MSGWTADEAKLYEAIRHASGWLHESSRALRAANKLPEAQEAFERARRLTEVLRDARRAKLEER